MTETYKVLPFLITELEDRAVIQNALTITIITNTTMIELFNYLDQAAVQTITEDLLSRYFGDKYKDALIFLHNNKLIKIIQEKKLEFSAVKVYTNNDVFRDSILFNSRGIDIDISVETFSDSEISFDAVEDNMFLFVLNPFNYKTLCELVSRIKTANALCRMAFYYNNKFYLSNYYKREWYNPCPLCYFAHIESYLRSESKQLNTVSFQTIIDLVYSKNPLFEVEGKFTNFSALSISDTLLRDLHLNSNRNITGVKCVDFINNIVECDQAIHWELCDCYE